MRAERVRLVTYRSGPSGRRLGAIVAPVGAAEDQVIDLAAASDGRLPGDFLSLLEGGPEALAEAARVARAVEGGTATVPLSSVRLLAPIARPPKVLAAAANYQEHINEGGGTSVDKTKVVPKLFIKPSSAIIGPDEAIPLPTVSERVDWELELAVVIGRPARDVSAERALDYVAGYTVINDISARSMAWGLPERASSNWDGFFDWLSGKWPNGFAPLGPWLVTADEIRDPQRLAMRLSVNGVVRQQATTGDMVFSCAELIAFASRFMTLEPGDVIATGTPGGVGAATGTFLRPGDVLEGWIEGVGTLRNLVSAPRS